mmetsp:Transcript_19681/g.25659  ORF Transcript_19681/g.25659 Transcript_19681/m.25659 type:complete len:203 (+) Transcript_19681:676-1284(+)
MITIYIFKKTLTSGGHTALLAAVENRQVGMVKALLEHGARTDVFNSRGMSPLLRAAEEGYTDVAIVLLEYGANPNTVAFFSRSIHPYMSIFSQYKIYSNKYRVVDGLTPLIMACHQNHLTMVQLLLESPQTNPNLCLRTGSTALIVSAFLGHVGIISLLLKHNDIDTKKQDVHGLTALSAAYQKSHTVIVTALIQHDRTTNN